MLVKGATNDEALSDQMMDKITDAYTRRTAPMNELIMYASIVLFAIHVGLIIPADASQAEWVHTITWPVKY